MTKIFYIAKQAVCSLAFCMLFAPTAAVYAGDLHLGLQDCISMAISNNEILKQAAEAEAEAAAGVSLARRSGGLALSWVSSYYHVGGRDYASGRRQHDIDSRYAAYDNELTNKLSISMPLYTSGELEFGIKGAESGLAAQRMAYRRQLQNLCMDVQEAYYQVLYTEAQIKVRKQSLDTLNMHYHDVKTRYEEGLYPMSDVWQTEVKMVTARQDLVDAINADRKSRSMLANIIGVDLRDSIIIDGGMEYVTYGKVLPECQAYALECRPDIMAADFAVSKAEADVRVAKSYKGIKLSASAAKILQGEGVSATKDHSDNWQVGLEASWNIFDNGVTDSKVDAAEARQRKAESEARELRDAVLLEVNTAYSDLLASDENVKISEAAIDVAQKSYTMAKVRYEEGVDTNLNVMDAEDSLTQIRMNYLKSLYNFNVAKAKLQLAMGECRADLNIIPGSK